MIFQAAYAAVHQDGKSLTPSGYFQAAYAAVHGIVAWVSVL